MDSMLIEPVRIYRLHWCVRHGRERVIRWREVKGRREQVREAAIEAAALSADGTVRITALDADGRPGRAVASSPDELATWRTERPLPRPAPSEWTRRIVERHARVANVARLRRLLGRFQHDGLLDGRQTAGIAKEVCLALDGLGGFGLPGGDIDL